MRRNGVNAIFLVRCRYGALLPVRVHMRVMKDSAQICIMLSFNKVLVWLSARMLGRSRFAFVLQLGNLEESTMKIITSGLMLLVFSAISPAALASKTSATSAIAQARVLIKAAERGGAQTFAPTELKTARDLLNTAQANVDNRNWTTAEYAAKKAQRDAEVADSKTQALKAEKSLAQIQSVVTTLRNELARKGGSE